jgi:hypothetical protein
LTLWHYAHAVPRRLHRLDAESVTLLRIALITCCLGWVIGCGDAESNHGQKPTTRGVGGAGGSGGDASLPAGLAEPPDGDLVLWYQRPATTWESQGLPIGNGRMGGMVFGGLDSDRVQFNEKSLLRRICG